MANKSRGQYQKELKGSHSTTERPSLREALILIAARRTTHDARRPFNRPREELRRVGERFSGDLALILSASPLADLGMGRIAQGFIPSHDRRNLLVVSCIALFTCTDQ